MRRIPGSVKRVATHVGGGAARFMLVYTAEKPNSAYAQLLVTVHDYKQIPENRAAIPAFMDEHLPDAVTFTKRFKLGPGEEGNIQIRFSGPDREELRGLAQEAMAIIEDNGGAQGTRHVWGPRVKVIRPVLAEAEAERLGITRIDVAKRIEAAFQGQPSPPSPPAFPCSQP